ncbi:MAG: multiprotein bridging factor aMBF1 [Euryarchaeota archaeon]|nr:multiprotein bridging factor aMBF1 [Euryarchaeota archaeon]
MFCEICGVKIIGQPSKIYVEGAELLVCRNCEQFGSKKWSRYPTATQIKVKLPKTKPKEDLFAQLDFGLIENYPDIIRRAREKKGWSQEDLARKINERLSVIKRVELGKMPPDTKLTKKLEKTLEIILTEKIPKEIIPKEPSKGELTIGDVIVVKKK